MFKTQKMMLHTLLLAAGLLCVSGFVRAMEGETEEGPSDQDLINMALKWNKEATKEQKAAGYALYVLERFGKFKAAVNKKAGAEEIEKIESEQPKKTEKKEKKIKLEFNIEQKSETTEKKKSLIQPLLQEVKAKPAATYNISAADTQEKTAFEKVMAELKTNIAELTSEKKLDEKIDWYVGIWNYDGEASRTTFDKNKSEKEALPVSKMTTKWTYRKGVTLLPKNDLAWYSVEITEYDNNGKSKSSEKCEIYFDRPRAIFFYDPKIIEFLVYTKTDADKKVIETSQDRLGPWPFIRSTTTGKDPIILMRNNDKKSNDYKTFKRVDEKWLRYWIKRGATVLIGFMHLRPIWDF